MVTMQTRHIVEAAGFNQRQQLRRHIAARATWPVSRTDMFRTESLVRTRGY